jgi:hypothetical protein
MQIIVAVSIGMSVTTSAEGHEPNLKYRTRAIELVLIRCCMEPESSSFLSENILSFLI